MTSQAKYWILTIPANDFKPGSEPPPNVAYLRGQLEQGEGGFLHWQLLACFRSKQRLGGVKSVFGRTAHCEPTRSRAAEEYVWKEATAVADTRFEIGRRPFQRNSSTSWSGVWAAACERRLGDIPSPIRVAHYRTIRTIASDYAKPEAVERQVFVYWGKSGAGKSRQAWEQAGWDAYPKDPRTKFWDGYQGQEHVVIDEFRGGIDVAHVLRWLDRYPVLVEIKGSSVPLVAKKIWITSNLAPSEWYPGLDEETLQALLRRLNITHFDFL